MRQSGKIPRLALTAKALQLLLIVACSALLLAAGGCGSDDSEDNAATAHPCQADPASAPAGTDVDAAREAAIAYFLTCDPAACTDDATKRHIQADYGGDLAKCEAVRRNNRLTRDAFTLAGDPKVEGDRAEVSGQVEVTGETFVIELKKVGGAWKVDRLRGSQ